jgi:single-strand DNA-binding protein
VVIFNENLINVAEQFLRKGSKIYIEGQLQTRKYTDNAGVEKYSTEVVLQRFRGELQMLDSRGGGDGGGGMGEGGPSYGNDDYGSSGGGGGGAPADLDDDIPF